MKQYIPKAALLMAENARDRLGYYQRELETLLRRSENILTLLRKIPAGDFTQQALFFEGDEIIAERARIKNCLENARAELEVAERVAREDSIYVDEKGEKK